MNSSRSQASPFLVRWPEPRQPEPQQPEPQQPEPQQPEPQERSTLADPKLPKTGLEAATRQRSGRD